ncbi:MAG TPA: polyprenyl synthetase family protein [Candidatus Bathyarchaeia archaeon]|nr:polyprenyl synthetase family protein [Candidatus Bathyarchaeia archaeon]
MSKKQSLVKQTVALLRKRGQKSLKISKLSVLQEKIQQKTLRDALLYFVDEVFPDIMHPGLLSVYCEAVGGDANSVVQVGAALMMLVGAADLHDDIIDESTVKNGKQTVLGKYGKDIAVLSGDAFLIKGLYLLQEAMALFPENKKNAILELIKQAFFDLSSAEAEEATYRGNIDLSGREYLELIKRKTAVSEATAKIGAIIGGGTTTEVKTLGEIGRIIGLLSTMRDDFIDVFELEELGNRATNEILPLPVLNVFQDPKKKDEITKLLKGRKLTKRRTERIVDIVMHSKETEELKKEMQALIKEGLDLASHLKSAGKDLTLILNSSVEDLQ